MQELHHLPLSPDKAFAALGNAVNVDVVELVARSLFGYPPPKVDFAARNHVSISGNVATALQQLALL
jgi:hypothetical protein